jgi:DNA repair protein RecN (Recombination protein N)
MLRSLRIENLVIIRDATLEFAPGLNVVTGETGAGKTILTQAIGLLLGAKSDQGFIGPVADEAYVEAELDVPAALLEEDGLEPLAELQPSDEPGLIVARRVFPDGRRFLLNRSRIEEREPISVVLGWTARLAKEPRP